MENAWDDQMYQCEAGARAALAVLAEMVKAGEGVDCQLLGEPGTGQP